MLPALPYCVLHALPLLILPTLPCSLQAIARGAKSEAAWEADCKVYAAKYPKEYAEFTALISGRAQLGLGKERLELEGIQKQIELYCSQVANKFVSR